jgi:nucleotide-binding universal stress UspA family protein
MFKKILTAIDGSDPAKHALHFAAELAEENKAELVVLAVIPHIHTYFSEDVELDYYPQLQKDMKKSYEDMLQKTVEELGRVHQDLKLTKILKEGNPAKIIVETAGKQGVDLIIIGNRGTSGVLSWMLGNTSRTVVEACTVPVLVVKDREYCEKKRN